MSDNFQKVRAIGNHLSHFYLVPAVSKVGLKGLVVAASLVFVGIVPASAAWKWNKTAYSFKDLIGMGYEIVEFTASPSVVDTWSASGSGCSPSGCNLQIYPSHSSTPLRTFLLQKKDSIMMCDEPQLTCSELSN